MYVMLLRALSTVYVLVHTVHTLDGFQVVDPFYSCLGLKLPTIGSMFRRGYKSLSSRDPQVHLSILHHYWQKA